MPETIEAIAQRFKSTYDLAGVAEAIYDSKLEFQWAGDSTDFTDANTLAELYRVRRMCCYEFVHFCAFLASPQFTLAPRNTPQLNTAAYAVYSEHAVEDCAVWSAFLSPSSYAVKVSARRIPRGAVVIGIARLFNNQSRYYHVGISTGLDTVISLSSGINLNRRSVGDVFGAFGYSQIRISNYRWRSMPGAGQPAPVFNPDNFR